MICHTSCFIFFFFNDTATTEIYTLSLHDALPISFTLSGLSKIAGLPQMKAAWIITSGPQEDKRGALARLEVISDTYLSPNALVQLAMPEFFAQRRAFQEQVMARVRKNLAELERQLAAQTICTR